MESEFEEIVSDVKIYHSPKLMDWGNLQNMTKGAGGEILDQADTSAGQLL